MGGEMSGVSAPWLVLGSGVSPEHVLYYKHVTLVVYHIEVNGITCKLELAWFLW
jgi:hypothetical protein